MKIQKRLLLTILPVVFITVLAVTSFAVFVSTNTVEKQVKDNAGLLSKSYSNQLNAKVNQVKRMTLDVASAIVTAVNVETALIDTLKRSPGVDRLLYTTLDGEIKDMAPYVTSLLSSHFLDVPEWKEAVSSKSIVISNPTNYMGENVILIYTPVVLDYVVNQNQKVIGVLVTSFFVKDMFINIDDVVYGETGSIVVINSNGDYIHSRDENLIMNYNISNLPSTTNMNNIIKAMKDMMSGMATYYNGSSKNFISFSGIPAAKWSLGIIGSYKEFSTQVLPLIFTSATILIIGLIFASLCIYFIVRGVVRPITVLTNMADKITEGDMSLRSNLKTSNEMGILSRAFDGMVERLEDYNKSLEKDVLKRTQELTTANKKLTSVNKKLKFMNESKEVLNEELTATNESLDRKNREMEAMNEELNSTNEILDQNARDLESMNEELKVTNEIMDQNSREIEAMNEELQVVNESLDEKNREMEAMNEELTVTVEELDKSNKHLEIARNSLWSEMELAHKLQTVLLPKEPKIKGFDISAFMTTTDSVGGDYYDVINFDGKDWFLIGDVSGHGVTAGLIMMMVQTSIHVALSQNPSSKPENLLTIINKIVHSNISKLGVNRYMTLTVFACLDHNKLSFAGAHLPIIVYRKKSNTVEMIETGGAWIGLIEDVQDLNHDREFSVDVGDVILLYTDGISEAINKDGKQYSQQALANLFKDYAYLDSNEICNVIKKQSESLLMDDDVTVMVLKKVSNEI